MSLLALLPLVCCCLLPFAITAQTLPDPGGGENQCRSLCTACQSLRPSRISQICSAGPLTGCGCPEYALNLTTAASDSTDRRNCPITPAAASVGFCPFGQRTDASGCPLGFCQTAPGCQPQDSNLRPPNGCKLYCPAGYQTDSTGCPVCRCRCEFGETGSDLQSADRLDRRCAEDCVATAGPTAGHELRAPDSPEGCPVCLCRVTVAQTAAVTPQPQPCLLRCPNSCGPHGYADAESRDDRGCVRDCSCRCPTRQGCPGSGDRCLRWEIDRFGCQVCSTCGSEQPSQRQPACITKLMLDSNAALLNSLCPSSCPQGFVLAPSAAAADCLTCSCHSVATQAPPVCPTFSLDACLATCPPGVNNATVARNANGCYECRCSPAPPAPVAAPPPPAVGCQSSPFFFDRCGGKSCGPHGFESDPVTGCQQGCRCNCPRRACGCFYGSRRDEFGCDTCVCVSATEYLQFLPF